MNLRHVVYTRSSVLSENRQVRVICSTESLGRDGLVLVTAGIDLTNFKRNPVVLWAHDPSQPIARAVNIQAVGTNLEALVAFPAPGISPKADEIYGLVKEDIINGISIGFDTHNIVPMDPADPYAGNQKVTACELQEFSFVSIPALADSLVTERSLHGRRSLPALDLDGYKRLLRRAQADVYRAQLGIQDIGVKKRSQKHSMTYHRQRAREYAVDLSKPASGTPRRK